MFIAFCYLVVSHVNKRWSSLKSWLHALITVIFFLLVILQSSCLQSVSIGWDGGVYVQTCGHTLHIDCHKSYMESLRVRESLSSWNYLFSSFSNSTSDSLTFVCPCFVSFRTTRSFKVFRLTRVNLHAHCVGSLLIAFFPAARGGAQRLGPGTRPQTRRYACL